MESLQGKNHRRVAPSAKVINLLRPNHSSPDLKLISSKLSDLREKIDSDKNISGKLNRYNVSSREGQEKKDPRSARSPQHPIVSATTIESDGSKHLRKKQIKALEKEVTSLLLSFDEAYSQISKQLDVWLEEAVAGLTRIHKQTKRKLAVKKSQQLTSAEGSIEIFIREISWAKRQAKNDQSAEEFLQMGRLQEAVDSLRTMLRVDKADTISTFWSFRQIIDSIGSSGVPKAESSLNDRGNPEKVNEQSPLLKKRILARSPSIERQSLQPESALGLPPFVQLAKSQPRLPKNSSLASLHSNGSALLNRSTDPTIRRTDFAGILQEQKMQYHSIKNSLGL